MCSVTLDEAQQNLQEWAQSRVEAGGCSRQMTSPAVGWRAGGAQGWLGEEMRVMRCLC